ncbi:head GIN domain-containing protein [Kordiimonas sp. SCSIO 12610]|uniref:head GIN domain-containing protein n=1 Tax=Kordiimonas sp. SCSIO 12610 TaxID=2829597 RepID=UPI00210B7F1E|nr:head GIN domain-containing protein [Kordiimonas sp. SCSIO 12610]UTW55725.1 DUF2807 domain-containing protein [Kordiimonas sp. SCSIO 12610]
MQKGAYIIAAAGLVTTAALATNSSKDVSEEMRDVADFTNIALQGSMDVIVTVGKEKSVKVIADSDIIDYLETEVKGDRLIIDLEDGRSYRNIKKMQVIVTTPSLEGASLYGSGDMDIKDVKSNKFDFELRGSGDAVLRDFSVKKLDIDLAGSGDIEGDGSCDNLEIDLRGSGDIAARDIKCENVEVNLRGSGDVNVFAEKTAEVNVRGSGDVDVFGDPDTLDSNVRGSGDVNRR